MRILFKFLILPLSQSFIYICGICDDYNKMIVGNKNYGIYGRSRELAFDNSFTSSQDIDFSKLQHDCHLLFLY